MSDETRGQFSSNFGFILASIGSAVGMGNLWRFPFYTGRYGGSIFLMVYLAIVVLFGMPLILAEMSVGKSGRKDSSMSFGVIAKQVGSGKSKMWSGFGVLTVLASLSGLAYYLVVGGWAIQYFIMSFTKPLSALDGDMFNTVTASPGLSVAFTVICLVLVCGIVLFGVKNGIEKANKIMLPTLLVMLVIIAIRSVTMPGAAEGLTFLFKPNMENVISAGGMGTVVLRALGAAFASMSIGYGTYITYCTYISRDENIIKSSIIAPIGDTAVALLAAFATIPMVFAVGMEPSAGPGMMFATMPQAFAHLGSMGRLFCGLFFLLALFAALTSQIAMLEVGTCWLEDSFKIERKKGCIGLSLALLVIAIPCALSYGLMSEVSFFGMNFFDFWSTLADVYILPLAALFLAIFVGWVWKPENALQEFTNKGTLKFPVYKIWKFLVKYFAPAFIIVVFIMSI